MVTRSEANSSCRLQSGRQADTAEQPTGRLNILCYLLDAAAEQYDLAEGAGDAEAAAEAANRLRAISAEIDALISY
jgi:hypothetical protein